MQGHKAGEVTEQRFQLKPVYPEFVLLHQHPLPPSGWRRHFRTGRCLSQIILKQWHVKSKGGARDLSLNARKEMILNPGHLWSSAETLEEPSSQEFW